MADHELLFKFDRYEFELRPMAGKVIYLKNKKTGKIVPVMLEGTFHRDGLVLGSTGYKDPEGSFEAEFAQTEDCYYGHGVENCRALAQRGAYPKNEWECVLKPGDQTVAIHIPAGADITDAYVMEAIRNVRPYIRQNYPGWDPVALYSGSWLFDPNLADIVGENSKIVRFGNLFIRHPIFTPGTSVFSFVFNKTLENNQVVPDMDFIRALPENTRLERGIKQVYLRGEAIINYSGAIFWDTDEK